MAKRASRARRTLYVRVDDDLKTRIEQLAAEVGMPASTYGRMAILNYINEHKVQKGARHE